MVKLSHNLEDLFIKFNPSNRLKCLVWYRVKNVYYVIFSWVIGMEVTPKVNISHAQSAVLWPVTPNYPFPVSKRELCIRNLYVNVSKYYVNNSNFHVTRSTPHTKYTEIITLTITHYQNKNVKFFSNQANSSS